MKKNLSLLIVMFALSFGMSMAHAEEQTLRIGENDSQTYYAPVYATWADSYYCSQILYAASELKALEGQQITKLAFFLRATTGSGDYEKVQIRLKEVDFTEFSEAVYQSIDDAELVFEGTLPASTATTLEVELDEPFVYEGGTLLVDVRKTEKGGSYAPTSGNKGRFQSTNGSTYTVLYNYGSSSLPTTCSRSANRPDIQFTYEEASAVVISCAKVSSVAASTVTAHEATLSWESEAENFEFLCVRKGAEHSFEGVSAQAVKTVTIDTLAANTEYDFYVRSYCSEDEQGKEAKVSFKTDLSCFAPTLLSVTATSSNSASFEWHGSGKGETKYQYTYGAYGSEPDWSKGVLTEETSATVSELNAASMYQVWVRSYCGEDDQSEAVTEYFATECGSITAPWSENFDNMNAETVPDCWDNSASTSPTATGSYDYYVWGVFERQDAKVLRMYNFYTEQGTALINTPSIVLPEKAQELTFDYSHRADCGAFQLLISTDNGVTFTELGSYEPTASTSTYDFGTFTTANVSLAAYAGQTVTLRFLATATYSGGAIFVDNIDIHEAPSCFKPNGLQVSEITAHGAQIAWTSEAAAWNYQLSADGETWGDAKAATANPFELTGLNANTLYYVRVQGNCGEEDLSEWSEAVSFRTECGALTLPYEEGFEGSEANELPACWVRVSEDGFPAVYANSYWDSRANTGTQSLKFYGWGISQMAVLPEMDKGLSELTLSFYYTATDDAEAPTASVGYITDLADASTFASAKELSAAETYTQAEVTFEGAPVGARIAILYKGGDYFGSLYIDDLKVSADEIGTGIGQVPSDQVQGTKVLENGVMYLMYKGMKYNVQGSVVR